jgi:cysteine sulfinate desulfinase/cysteine desulfurase-like protein
MVLGAIRFSLGEKTTKKDIRRTITALKAHYGMSRFS